MSKDNESKRPTVKKYSKSETEERIRRQAIRDELESANIDRHSWEQYWTSVNAKKAPRKP